MTDHENLIKTLNHLLDVCVEGRRGYEHAAEHIDEEDLKTLFTEFATERNEFAYELRHLIQELGSEPHEGHNPYATLHRSWVDIQTALSHDDTQIVLRECRRGEEVALRQYLSALADELDDARATVWKQYEAIKIVKEKITQLLKNVEIA